MITPEQVELLAQPLIEIYASMETDLIVNVSKRLANDLPTISGTSDWLLSKMQESGALRKENIAILARMSGKTVQELERILKSAGYKSLELAESIYKDASAAGLTMFEALPITSSMQVQQILLSAVRNAQNTINLVNTTALNSANSEFLRIINQVYLETSAGYYSYNSSVSKAVRELADKGITGVTYQTLSGRLIRYTPDVAVRRTILTSSAQTAGKLQVARADEWGAQLVEVSSHWGARPEHAVWQGKVYRLHGSDSKYANLAEATGYGTGEGLCGYNCRHVMYPFFEGISKQRYKPYDQQENERRYDEFQEQRSMERDLRRYKRREAAALAAGDNEGVQSAKIKIADINKDMRQFINKTGNTRRRSRERIT